MSEPQEVHVVLIDPYRGEFIIYWIDSFDSNTSTSTRV
jgi:hypothetical protein